MDKVIPHPEPAWGSKADFIIRARCVSASQQEELVVEQLWARRVREDVYEVCCIPFLLYNVALGDQVRTDSEHWLTDVVERSGHYCFRVWFGASPREQVREAVLAQAGRWNALHEWHGRNLLALDVPSEEQAAGLSGYLRELEQRQELAYETGRL